MLDFTDDETFMDSHLVRFSKDEKDWWRIRHAFEGTQIFGGIGSGKTSGSGRMIAKAFLRNGFGGLVHCAKPNEVDTWKKYAAETGRTQDLVIFEEGSNYFFNPLEYENKREGPGGGEVFNLSNLFMEIYKMGNRFTGGGGGDKDRYWDNALKRCLNRMILLLKSSEEELSIENMIRIMTDAPTEEEVEELNAAEDDEWGAIYDSNFCIQCVYKIVGVRERKENELELLEEAPDKTKDQYKAIIKLKEDIYELYNAFEITSNYFFRQFAKADEKTRSIVSESFLGLAEPFTMGVLKKHFAGGLTILPEWSWEGKIIILNFSVKEYLDSGMYAQGIFKYLWQQSIERRKVKDHPRPCFLWVDESQYFVNEYDTIFQTTARSSRTATVLLTQNISNYFAQMGGAASQAKVNSLLGNLSTKIFHANNDSVTNEWASKIIGQALQNLKSSGESRKSFEVLPENTSTNESPHLLPQVLPMQFTTLPSGGPLNQFLVQAYIVVKGHSWPGGKNYRLVNFRQK